MLLHMSYLHRTGLFLHLCCERGVADAAGTAQACWGLQCSYDPVSRINFLTPPYPLLFQIAMYVPCHHTPGRVKEAAGRVDMLVLCAAIAGKPYKLSPQVWRNDVCRHISSSVVDWHSIILSTLGVWLATLKHG